MIIYITQIQPENIEDDDLQLLVRTCPAMAETAFNYMKTRAWRYRRERDEARESCARLRQRNKEDTSQIKIAALEQQVQDLKDVINNIINIGKLAL